MKIRFQGAVRSVTGSMHLLEVGDRKLLLECGLYQGKRAEAALRNRHLPFDPKSVTGCVLSHAHIDHSGNLPNLIKGGYAGPIHATSGTVDLAKVLLADSAQIQQKDVEYLNERRAEGEPLIEALYGQAEVRETNARFQAVDYKAWFEPMPGVRACFYDAGHILGSAVTVYEVDDGPRKVRIAFTGDLGRPAQPILRDPQHIPAVDYLITESTYGNRVHEGLVTMKEHLRAVVAETVERGGRVVIPAFSVGRTQNVVYYLSQLFHEGALPRVKIFIDSPMSADATRAYKDHPECYDDETRELMARGDDVFGFQGLTYARSQEESKAINAYDKPCIIISASGMCEAGRILHHLKHSIGKAENTVLIVGFQAEHTLGRRLLDKARTVRIYGREVPVRCRVEKMNGCSAHADKDELSAYVKNVPGLKGVFVVHGEEAASLELAAHLTSKAKLKTHVPTLGEAVDV